LEKIINPKPLMVDTLSQHLIGNEVVEQTGKNSTLHAGRKIKKIT
jgi:hypothetical protein